MMNVYFDNCSLQRPLDSKTQIRIAVEAEAIVGVIALIEAGSIGVISSQALLFEIKRNPNPLRQELALEILSKAEIFVELTREVENRSKEFGMLGIKPLDALYLASAEAAKADYFCTCDDQLLKKAKAISGINLKVVSPVELIEEIELWK